MSLAPSGVEIRTPNKLLSYFSHLSCSQKILLHCTFPPHNAKISPPLRTIEQHSRWLRQLHFLGAFFEKNEKEPKKKGKRTEKERNSVTTAVGQPPAEGENPCRAKDQSVGPTVRKRRQRTAATSNRETGCKDTKIKIK